MLHQNHILTFKIPTSLLQRLEEVSKRLGQSKGALVREGLKKFLDASLDEEGRQKIEAVTQRLIDKKKVAVKVDWENLKQKASVSGLQTPEEEVLLWRRRGL